MADSFKQNHLYQLYARKYYESLRVIDYVILLIRSMQNNTFSDVVNILLQIKIALQRGNNSINSQILQKIDLCISKIAPLIDIYEKSSYYSCSESMEESKLKSSIVSRTNRAYSANFQIAPNKQKISNEQIAKVKNSFLRQSIQEEMIQSKVEKQSVLMDYFVVRYNLDLNEYTISGKNKGGQTDRKVFADLITFDNKPSHVQKIPKSSSMTNILKQIFSQSKATNPFILPNCQEAETKYLFVFGLRQCGVKEKEYYRTETFCCFVSKQFIIKELTQLMDEISSYFELRAKEASSSEDEELLTSISSLYRKKTYQCIEKIVERFIDRYQSKKSNQLCLKNLNFLQMDHYLQNTELLWAIVKRSKTKDQKLLPSLVLLYYFALNQYKIICLAKTQQKNLISELAIGLIRALGPLTYTYPIVGATITTHHFEFVNSPVPIFVGLWGNQIDLSAAKKTLKTALKAQKNMSAAELANEINFVVFDLQDHSLMFSQNSYKQICSTCQALQAHIDSQTQDNIASKLGNFTIRLLNGQLKKQQWSQKLKQRIKATHMYDYFKSYE